MDNGWNNRTLITSSDISNFSFLTYIREPNPNNLFISSSDDFLCGKTPYKVFGKNISNYSIPLNENEGIKIIRSGVSEFPVKHLENLLDNGNIHGILVPSQEEALKELNNELSYINAKLNTEIAKNEWLIEVIIRTCEGAKHELRNLVSPIIMAVDSLKYSKNLNSAQKYIKKIDSGNNKLHTILNMFDFQKLLERKNVNPNHILNQLKIAYPQVNFNYDKDSNSEINMSELELGIISNTLIQNACDATADIVNPKISVDAKYSAKKAIISISDNGGGFNSDILKDIRKGKSKSTKLLGRGQGLKNLRKILSSYGGTIDFSSNEYGGATVSVSIPYSSNTDDKSKLFKVLKN